MQKPGKRADYDTIVRNGLYTVHSIMSSFIYSNAWYAGKRQGIFRYGPAAYCKLIVAMQISAV